MQSLLKLLASTIFNRQWFRQFGIGLTGMTCCMLGLLVALGATVFPDFRDAMDWLARTLWLDRLWNIGDAVTPIDNLKQLFLVFGAALLARAAFDRGPEGRLFQTLECELVIFGILFYLPIPSEILLVLRLSVTVIGASVLYYLGFLKGTYNKIGAVGLEALGIGYSFGSNEGMFIGGFLLTIYCAEAYFREQSFINALWLGLNGPFAGASLALCILPFVTTMENQFNVVMYCLIAGLFYPFVLIEHELRSRANRKAVEDGAILIAEPTYPGAPTIYRAVCPCCRRDWPEVKGTHAARA